MAVQFDIKNLESKDENIDKIPLPLPEVKKLKKSEKNKKVKSKKQSSVIYLGHIPYGFFEPQMRNYFSQFGEIGRLKLSRNKKTGKSKNYAFIEFFDPDIAEIVVQTMNGYMLFDRTLVCHIIPPEDVHPQLFANSKHFFIIPHRKLVLQKQNQGINKKKNNNRIKRLLFKERKKRQLIEHLSLNYDFPGYQKDIIPPCEHIIYE